MAKANVTRANARCLPLADESVDLIITSPPYFALRSYRDSCETCGGRAGGGPQLDGYVGRECSGCGERTSRIKCHNGCGVSMSATTARSEKGTVEPDPGCPQCHGNGNGHYDGQIGSEPTPREFLEALWAVTAECWRVLKPTGTMFVNLGDKRSGSGGHNNNGLTRSLPGIAQGYANSTAHKRAGEQVVAATRRNAPDRYNQAAFGRPKSKMLLPHRYAIGCEDGLADPEGIGWIVRQDIVWSKLNGLPESVTDRCRDSHEYWFQLNKTGRYFSAVDEVREAYDPASIERYKGAPHQELPAERRVGKGSGYLDGNREANPLGKLPGSVWAIASEPLVIPDAVKAHYNLPDHFAAFPQEWPRRLILGWSPGGVCTACGEGRRPVVAKDLIERNRNLAPRRYSTGLDADAAGNWTAATAMQGSTEATITGYACACPNTSAPTNPAVVLDPFAGTGTVLGVAEALGRTGIGVDLSMDYARLAKWRVERSGHFSKTNTRTWRERQGAFDFEGEMA